MERMLDLPWQNAQWSNVCICKDAPADMVVALGSGYQRLFVIPSSRGHHRAARIKARNFLMRISCGCCLAAASNSYAGLTYLSRLANDQTLMKQNLG